SGFFSFMKGFYPDRYAPNVQTQIDQQRFDMLFKDWWIVSLIVVAGLGLVYLAMQKKIGVSLLGVGILAITIVDIWRVDAEINHPVPNTAMENYLKPDQLTTFLQRDESVYRIFPLNIPFIGLKLFEQNRWAAQGIESIGGYSPAKPRVYQDLLDASDIANRYIQKYYVVGQQNGQRALQQIPNDRIDPALRKVQQNLLNLLNVKYLISPYPIPEPAIENVGQVNLIVNNQQLPLGIFENKSVLARAFLVGNFKKVADPKTALNALVSPEFDPKKEVVLYEDPEHSPAPDSTASADLVEYGLHRITVKTNSIQPQILVLSDTWYPASWHVTVDGQDAKMLQANHAFRAVSLPAGEHEVVFYFSSSGFRLGLWLTILSTLAVAGCIVVGMRMAKDKN
ncbi:MAG: YfhO family protein, partial [bacterium]